MTNDREAHIVNPETPCSILFGRLTPAEDQPLRVVQQEMADQLNTLAVPFARQAGFRPTDDQGRLIGPWNMQVHRPEIAHGYNAWVAADQANSTLPPDVREIAILTCAVTARSTYETYAHSAAARAAGIAPQIVEAVRTGQQPAELTTKQAAARAFASELTTSLAVSQPVFDQARSALGEVGVIDLANLVAIYIATAALLGAFAIKSPEQLPAR